VEAAVEPTQTTRNKQAGAKGKRVGTTPGLSGRLQVEVPGAAPRFFEVKDGALEPVEPSGPADAVITCRTEDDCKALLGGQLNPIVAALQGRLNASGDATFAAKLILGLQGEKAAPSTPAKG
jgi:putative sterol carrier protein